MPTAAPMRHTKPAANGSSHARCRRYRDKATERKNSKSGVAVPLTIRSVAIVAQRRRYGCSSTARGNGIGPKSAMLAEAAARSPRGPRRVPRRCRPSSDTVQSRKFSKCGAFLSGKKTLKKIEFLDRERHRDHAGCRAGEKILRPAAATRNRRAQSFFEPAGPSWRASYYI